MRLVKHLAHAGVASRRASEALIFAGRVKIDGQTVTDPARDVDGSETITVDGAEVHTEAKQVVYAVHKPFGIVSTAHDPRGRPTVVDLVPDTGLRLYPIGRLDADSTGLILLTNDGELAYRLTHPRFEVDKTYHVIVGNAPVRERALRTLRDGVELDDGRTAPAQVRRIGGGKIELIIHEGRKRQVRRMCAGVGHPVRALERVGYGPLRLSHLPLGAHRRVSPAEIERLRAATSSRVG